MYPSITLNRDRLRQNVRVMTSLCRKHGIGITGVTKGFCADPSIAQIFFEEGITRFGDSRILNLNGLKGFDVEKWLIRPPMCCETENVITCADVSVNSEYDTILRLNHYARIHDKPHKVILMADLGDIREGFTDYQELFEVAEAVESLDYIELYGIGTNLTCFSFIQPTFRKMEQLSELAKQIEERIGRQLEIVSGGNSATLDLMVHGGIPPKINNLRLGESLLFGRERANYQYLPDTFHDAFVLHAQIIELKYKPSLPWGTVGVDSYGSRPSFTDRGEKRLKAICAIGKQDFDLETTVPVDPGILMLGCSSDHLMLDITDSMHTYHLGDIIDLIPGYFSLMRAFTSKYIQKSF